MRPHLHACGLHCAALAASLLALSSGCALRTIQAPEGMTREEAKSVIEEYLTGQAVRLWNDADGVEVTDESFTRVVRYNADGEPGYDLETVRYADLGDYELVYTGSNVVFFLGFGFFGPTFVDIRDASGESVRRPKDGIDLTDVEMAQREKSILLSLTPVWIAFPSLWSKTDEETFLAALAYMKKEARRGEGAGATQSVVATSP